MRSAIASALLSLALLSPGVAHSQGGAPSSPIAGTWAGELGFGDGTTGTLLRFRSPTSAWTIGARLSIAQRSEEGGGFGDDDETSIATEARLGLRSYRGGGNAVRPLLGFGLFGSYAEPASSTRSWAAGLFSEFGAVRFFGPSLSLGALAEARLGFGENRLDGGVISTRTNSTTLSIGGLRVVGTVYF
jgi:hypothetical protein